MKFYFLAFARLTVSAICFAAQRATEAMVEVTIARHPRAGTWLMTRVWFRLDGIRFRAEQKLIDMFLR